MVTVIQHMYQLFCKILYDSIRFFYLALKNYNGSPTMAFQTKKHFIRIEVRHSYTQSVKLQILKSLAFLSLICCT